MNDTKKKEHIVYADILRIAAAFSVVLLHVAGARVICEPIGGARFLCAVFYDCVTRWSVPLFIMLSGMLFLKKDKKINIKTLYTKNIFRLFTAFVFWSYVYNLYTSYAQCKNIKEALITAFFEIPKGAMHTWFLFVIAGLYVVLPFIKKMTQAMTKREAEYFIFLSFLLTFVTKSLSSFEIFVPYTEYVQRFEINLVLGYVGLFVAGWYIDKFEHTKAFRAFVYLAAIVGFLYMFVTTVYFSIKRGVVADEFMSFKSVGAFAMAFGVMMLFKQLFAKKKFSAKTKSNLKYYSGYTFGIYLIHELLLNVSSAKGWVVLPEFPMAGIIIEAVAIFVISGVITGIIQCFPFGKYIS